MQRPTAITNYEDPAGELIVLGRPGSEQSYGDESQAISVLLADSAGLVRAGLRALIENESDITVAGQAGTGEEAVALAIERRPDVVLMDVRISGMSGVEATRRIVAALAHVKVLILSASEGEDDLFAALRAGASGFLIKDTEPVDLLRAVRAVAGGGAHLSPNITRRLIEEFMCLPDMQRPCPTELEELTAREREVVTLVALGLSNSEIAQRLVVSPATAKTHVSRAMVKLHTRDRAKLVALAYETGFVEPPRRRVAPPLPRLRPTGPVGVAGVSRLEPVSG